MDLLINKRRARRSDSRGVRVDEGVLNGEDAQPTLDAPESRTSEVLLPDGIRPCTADDATPASLSLPLARCRGIPPPEASSPTSDARKVTPTSTSTAAHDSAREKAAESASSRGRPHS